MYTYLLIQGLSIPLWSSAPRNVLVRTVNKTGMTAGTAKLPVGSSISYAQLVSRLDHQKLLPLQTAGFYRNNNAEC